MGMRTSQLRIFSTSICFLIIFHIFVKWSLSTNKLQIYIEKIIFPLFLSTVQRTCRVNICFCTAMSSRHMDRPNQSKQSRLVQESADRGSGLRYCCQSQRTILTVLMSTHSIARTRMLAGVEVSIVRLTISYLPCDLCCRSRRAAFIYLHSHATIILSSWQ